MQFFANANYDLCEFFQVPKVALGKNPLYLNLLKQSFWHFQFGNFILTITPKMENYFRVDIRVSTCFSNLGIKSMDY